jgi:hypothetical protein
MARTATWKVVTIGAALTGLGVVGAGTASAATSPAPTVNATISAPHADWSAAFADDSPDASFNAMDDSWDDSPDDD